MGRHRDLLLTQAKVNCMAPARRDEVGYGLVMR